VGVCREQAHELLERARGAEHRAHLEPVTEQHDVDQRRGFPEEDVAGKAEHDQRAVGVGDRDRERYERHHAGEACTDLVHETREERPAAVEVDGRRETEADVAVARERQRVAEPKELLDHVRGREHWQREHQRDPQAPPKVRHRMGVIGVTGVAGCPRSGVAGVLMMVVHHDSRPSSRVRHERELMTEDATTVAFLLPDPHGR